MKDNRTELGSNQVGIRILAKKLYIVKGFTIDEIRALNVFKKVSRKTLYNWMTRDKWKEKRERRLDYTEKLEERIDNLLNKAIEIATENPTEDNLKKLEMVQQRHKFQKEFIEDFNLSLINQLLEIPSEKPKDINQNEITISNNNLIEIDGEKFISLQDLAKRINPKSWEKKYNTLRKRASRGVYITYKTHKRTGVVNINDPYLKLKDSIDFLP